MQCRRRAEHAIRVSDLPHEKQIYTRAIEYKTVTCDDIALHLPIQQ